MRSAPEKWDEYHKTRYLTYVYVSLGYNGHLYVRATVGPLISFMRDINVF